MTPAPPRRRIATVAANNPAPTRLTEPATSRPPEIPTAEARSAPAIGPVIPEKFAAPESRAANRIAWSAGMGGAEARQQHRQEGPCGIRGSEGDALFLRRLPVVAGIGGQVGRNDEQAREHARLRPPRCLPPRRS
jgi:hypothetical protein